VPDLFWCAGQGGYGFQSAPGASSFLADLIAGRATGYDAGFVKSVSPGRFA
jgi:glycine/D-amino acid oxidase-like deaminating enzyme